MAAILATALMVGGVSGTSVDAPRVAMVSAAHREPLAHATKAERSFLACVRRHESHGNYRAENPTSTSSGSYQFIDATWRGNAKWARWGKTYPGRGYRHAADAPKWIQDLVALHAIRNGGHKAWHGTGCAGT